MKLTKAIINELINGATETFEKVELEYLDAQTKYNDAKLTLAWANTLREGEEFTANTIFSGLLDSREKEAKASKRELYFLESRSGRSQGHFIEHHKDATWTCSCPGGSNRGYCWAITELVAKPQVRRGHKFLWSDHDFDFRAKYRGEGDRKAAASIRV